MYNLNTKQGKEHRVKRLKELIIKVGHRDLTIDDEREIITYLSDIKIDLEGQLFLEKMER